MTTIFDKLEELGYRVAKAQEGGERHIDPTTGVQLDESDPRARRIELADTYAVEGVGVSIHVRDDDEAAVASLLRSHPDREFQAALDSDGFEALRRLLLAGVDVDGSAGGPDEALVGGRLVSAASLSAVADELLGPLTPGLADG